MSRELPRIYEANLPKKYKYNPSDTECWQDADEQALAKLVAKYGPQAVIAMATQVRKRPPGRPSRGDLPDFEKISDADWIDDRIEEFRTRGETAPVTRARELFFFYQQGFDVKPPNETQLATIKKRHLEGRREGERRRRPQGRN